MAAKQPPVEDDEVWRDVVGYEDLYLVSDRGRVWSVPRKTWHEASERRSGCWHQTGGRPLRANPNSGGYLTVVLCRDGIKTTHQVHALVAEAFLGPAPAGMEVLHGPNGKLDNQLDNLRYGTRVENQRDRLRDGTDNRGERNGSARLTEDDVREIRRLYASTEHLRRRHHERWTLGKLGTRFGVDQSTISIAIRGKTWTHVEVEAA